MFFLQLTQVPMPRLVSISSTRQPPLAVASDGRLDGSGPPSIATLIVDPVSKSRVALLATVPDELTRVWDAGDHIIGLVEQSAVVLGICGFPDRSRHRDCIWYEDNSVVLRALLKAAATTHAWMQARLLCIWYVQFWGRVYGWSYRVGL